MQAEQVRQVVLDIIADVSMEDDLSNIKDEVALRDQLDLDSMDFLDIVMELKKRHKVEVPQEDYPRLASLSSCVEYLTPKMMQ
ncbi:MAG: acyl carrier protein [Bdellovibrio sp. CG12_big_fil_rev_8_21_14_0_65_39_13]|nr:acyl carrier protein [Bdellovibrionales bacterium]PIP93145.1 MAG: acyl carrier protein [Bdellovibrio sp. CG22_combo_CG10-13_8_21_14_all_39_27]PIQ61330.1 MAG: acyl carrier protein [Bdellovibrio sp. CG12_big_fil_rev_8_21_14_0_65_39_13]PIR35660.1 MAG: acyl carrier protein [Bdellovibrio sp. CG11_big_fil_rev_8_21_14_0_20_39_38]